MGWCKLASPLTFGGYDLQAGAQRSVSFLIYCDTFHLQKHCSPCTLSIALSHTAIFDNNMLDLLYNKNMRVFLGAELATLRIDNCNNTVRLQHIHLCVVVVCMWRCRSGDSLVSDYSL